ncbi:SdpI family protein [Nocardiopsis sp. M1B1]|uniref:SdpI family protein n=1 Tax=Nocardiopsis sp. M1B1 TaxID=3450454 RepID=UPI00403A6A19
MPPFADNLQYSEPMSGVGLVMFVLTLGATAAALLIAGYLSGRGRLHPNLAFGIRTKYTLSDDDAWYTVHSLAAPWTIASGVAMAVPPIVVAFLDDFSLQMVVVLAPMGVGLVLLFLGVWRAERTARARAARDTDAP